MKSIFSMQINFKVSKKFTSTRGIKVSYKFEIIIINGHNQACSNYSK